METPLDHFFNDRIDPENFNALTCGPLAVHLKAYAQELYDQGYAVQTAQLQLRMLGNFNRWLQSYTPVVRAFLAECFPTEIPDFHQLCASDIAGFVKRQAERITAKYVILVGTALRS
jgi:hypothetical protein